MPHRSPPPSQYWIIGGTIDVLGFVNPGDVWTVSTEGLR